MIISVHTDERLYNEVDAGGLHFEFKTAKTIDPMCHMDIFRRTGSDGLTAFMGHTYMSPKELRRLATSLMAAADACEEAECN